MNNVTLINAKNNLDELSIALKAAKQARLFADADVKKFEKAIIEIVGNKVEGTTTINTDHFKVSTAGKLTRTVDSDAVEQISQSSLIPEPLFNRLFKRTYKLSLPDYRYLVLNEPEWHKVITEIGAVTTKSAKTSVSVDDIQK